MECDCSFEVFFIIQIIRIIRRSLIAKSVQALKNEVKGLVEADAGMDSRCVEFWEVLVEVSK